MANPSYTPKTGRDITNTNGSLLFFDNSGPAGANTFQARAYTNSDLSANLGAKAEAIRTILRGKQISRRKGNNPQIEITFTIPLFQFTNGSQDVLLDVLDGTGNINGSWTKHTSSCEEWNTGLQIIKDGVTQGDSDNHKIVLPAMVYEWTWAENDNAEDVISVTATCEDWHTFDTDTANFGKFGPA